MSTAALPITRPSKRPDEPFQDWIARMETWARTPEGLAYDAAIQAARDREIARDTAYRRKALLAESGLPERTVRLFETSDPYATEAMEAIGAHGWTVLALSGAAGCGKTTAACWWIHDAIGRTPARAPKFVTAAALSRASKYDHETMDGYLLAPRLVVDDLGVEYQDAKGFFASMFDELLDARYSSERPVILTTNLPAEQFKVRYGERIARRIREAGKFVELSNASLV